ncbi:MAG: hypothetical protein EP333_08955 [Bacteroidetes bacterium]|nr:MAG: hypothetical protein EP333_08955 [Bacteroidota bacterium]
MLYFWLFAGILSLLGITIMGFVEGFELWVFYYIVPIICFFMYLVRKWMMKRMEKHLQFLEEQQKNKNS